MSTYNVTRPTKPALYTHTEYDYYFEDWLTMFDTHKGEREVKAQNETYLPKTYGMTVNPNGNAHYESYKKRAVFFEYVTETIFGMLGMFWQKSPQIKTNEKSKDWMKNASITGHSFIEVYKNVVYNQLWKGRYGILMDIPNDGQQLTTQQEVDIPQMVEYTAEAIVNWGTTLYRGKEIVNFVLLDESAYEIDNITLKYELKNKWRLCGLFTTDAEGNELPEPVYYTVGSYFTKKDISELRFDYKYGDEDVLYPQYRGKTLPYIPFIFINITNLDPSIEKPPLMPLANISLAIYRGDADYRQTLYKQTQATLFGRGFSASDDIAVGADSAVITQVPEAHLEYVEVSGNGLDAMRQSENDLKDTAIQMGTNLIEKTSGDETGASVAKHINNKTSTLKSISKTSSEAMLKVLQIINDWTDDLFGEVNIVPSMDYAAINENADGLFKLWSVVKEGGLTKRDFYEWLKQNDYTTYANFEEWDVAISNLEDLMIVSNDEEHTNSDMSNDPNDNNGSNENEE